MNWTDDRVELLKRLWTEGLSASQIALQLGEATSRNAVIGKVHRLGLAGRAKAVVPAAPRQRKPRAAGPVVRMARPGGVVRGNTALVAVTVYEEEVSPAVAPRVATENVVPIGQRCNILELGIGRCRWPVGDPGASDFFFCGGKTAGVSPYCGYHARIAYHPPADRRARRAADANPPPAG